MKILNLRELLCSKSLKKTWTRNQKFKIKNKNFNCNELVNLKISKQIKLKKSFSWILDNLWKKKKKIKQKIPKKNFFKTQKFKANRGKEKILWLIFFLTEANKQTNGGNKQLIMKEKFFSLKKSKEKKRFHNKVYLLFSDWHFKIAITWSTVVNKSTKLKHLVLGKQDLFITISGQDYDLDSPITYVVCVCFYAWVARPTV